jgi:hypothetical protein
MKMTIELDEHRLVQLLNYLKITDADYEAMLKGRKVPDYAKRIISARCALDLTTQREKCVITE